MAVEAVNASRLDTSGCGNYSDSSSSSALLMMDCNQTFTNASGFVKPSKGKEMDSFRILLYVLIFLVSVVGNLLILVVLVLNKRMRTVTNCFLLSLAVSDLMMALFCMPFTLIPNIMEDYVFGETMCKTTAYFMGLSVSISTFSLVAIAIERYSAICNPLQSRSWQTRSHAYRVIALTWLLSLLLMVPYPVFSIIKGFNKPGGEPGHMCRLSWPSAQAEQAWYMILLFLLFFIPGVVMSVAYGLISRELYKGMQFEINQEAAGQQNGATRPMIVDDDDGCYIQKKPPSGVELPTLSSSAAPKPERARSNTSQAKLQAKRRVVRMLMVIVALFFVCWMPLYVVNTWKAFDARSIVRALSGAPISFIHLLSYTSACVNPVIYCFMNTRFRKALLSTFSCACCQSACSRRKERNPDDGFTAMSTATSMATSMSKISYTTVSSVATC